MPKPKADAWLTSAFAEGVPELAGLARPRPAPPYPGALGRCFLAQHDERRRPCSGPLERFHFIGRQRVENALGALLPDWRAYDAAYGYNPVDLILLAAWDPRNAEVGCEGHHRRYDRAIGPALTVPALALPTRTVDFIFDYGLDGPAEDRWPGFNDALCDDREGEYSAPR